MRNIYPVEVKVCWLDYYLGDIYIHSGDNFERKAIYIPVPKIRIHIVLDWVTSKKHHGDRWWDKISF